MTEGEDINARLNAVCEKLRRVHGVQGRDVAEALRRGKRAVPRALKADLALLSSVSPQLGHPKLERQMDIDAIAAAEQRVSEHLDSVDLAEQRRDWWLSYAGVVAFNLLVVIVAFIVWLVWAGIV